MFKIKAKALLPFLLGLLAIGAVTAYQVDNSMKHPVFVKLQDSACKEIHDAKPLDGKPTTPAPCSFQAYMFRSEIGWVGYGYSPNIKDQCVMFAYEIVDTDSFKVDMDAPRLDALPAKCQAEWAQFHPKIGLF